MKYSFEKSSFYDTNLFNKEQLPSDCVDLTAVEYKSLLDGLSQNKVIVNQSGRPVAIDKPIEPLTREQVEANRLRAYSDPLTGSDRFFAEATRLQAMGGSESEVNAAKETGAARYDEIQTENPWPDI